MPEKITKSKPLGYYQVKVSTLLDLALDNPDNRLLAKIAKGLLLGVSDIPQIQEIIDCSNDFREKKRQAGRKGGLAKASSAIASLENAKAKASSAKFCSGIVKLSKVKKESTLKALSGPVDTDPSMDGSFVEYLGHADATKAKDIFPAMLKPKAQVNAVASHLIEFSNARNGLNQKVDNDSSIAMIVNAMIKHKNKSLYTWYAMIIHYIHGRYEAAKKDGTKPDCMEIVNTFRPRKIVEKLSSADQTIKMDNTINRTLSTIKND